MIKEMKEDMQKHVNEIKENVNKQLNEFNEKTKKQWMNSEDTNIWMNSRKIQKHTKKWLMK
jgi:alkylhydroperoxidase/carboxymuconolactone decarboxylase family protein YurZ